MQNSYRGLRSVSLSPDELFETLASCGSEPVTSGKKASVRASARMKLFAEQRQLTAAYARCAGDDSAPGLIRAFAALEQTIKELREEWPERQMLPVMLGGEYDGSFRVYRVAVQIVGYSGAKLSLERIEGGLNAYQRDNALTVSELWAMPAALKAALIRRCAVESVECLRACSARERAYRISARAKSIEPNEAEKLFDRQDLRDPYFSEKLCSLLGQSECAIALHAALRRADLTAVELASRAHRAQVRSTAVFENAAASLRLLSSLEWETVFRRVSKTDRILSEDTVYGRMDAPSRRYYLECVQRMARRAKVREEHVARCALALAQKPNSMGRKAHVGWYLVDEGRAELTQLVQKTGKVCVTAGPAHATGCIEREADFSKDPFPPEETSDEVLQAAFSPRKKLSPAGRKLLGLLIGVWVISQTFLVLCGVINGTAWAFLIGTPASIATWTLGQEIVQRILSRLPVRRVPRMSLKDGVPDCARTLVVVPALVSSPDKAREMVQKLEVHAFACARQRNILYALLADLPEADAEDDEQDNELLHVLSEETQRLNEKYPHSEPAFYTFCRKRTLTPEGRYMGRERKRGALEDLNHLLLFDKRDSMRLMTGVPHNITYVLTLDADTILPMDSAVELIGAMLHPLNTPAIEKDGKVSGHAVIAPRMECTASGAQKSYYAKLFSGRAGLDSYATEVSEIYQDLFGQGNYGGKGIYDVRCFDAALKDRIQPNTVLSHDLLEGSFANAAYASNVALYDDFPERYLPNSLRMERWIRGDWQLVRYLLFAKGLTPIARYKMTDNLRRSLIAPAALAVLLSAPFLRASWPFTLLAVLSLIFGYLIDFVRGSVRARDAAVRARDSWDGLWSALYRALFALAVLPYEGILYFSAIVKSLWRSFVSHRNLLQWVTAADAEKGGARTLSGHYRAMIAGPVCGTLLAVAALWTGRVLFLLIAALWWLGPLFAWLLTKPLHKNTLSVQNRELLERAARGAWSFFEECCTEKRGMLPPDNVQADPKKPPAERTSPTNIAMALLAPYAAWSLGYLGEEERDRRTMTLLHTLCALPKWKGHLYNWIDIRTKKPLPPRFISSVDSGNLAAALLCVRQLYENTSIGQTAGELLCAMDFSALYDSDKELFSIGFDEDAGRCTEAHYDLLASESRLLSLVSIALGAVPSAHWFRLGRPLTAIRGRRMLLSWSGTMFEYLMPVLLTGAVDGTLLGESVLSVVEAQRATGRQGLWGVSESGYYAFDPAMNYQYRAFGIPGAGVNASRGEVVLAPYAAALAAMIEPEEAAADLRRMEALGLWGKYGFYESVDFTQKRVAPERYRIVKSFMAHHEGMALLSLANVLTENVFVKAFCSAPEIRAAKLLLEEREPDRTAVMREYSRALPDKQEENSDAPMISKVVRAGTKPETCVLCGRTVIFACSDGRTHAAFSSDGSDRKIHLYRPEETFGFDTPPCMLYLKNERTGAWSALTGDAKMTPWKVEWKGECCGASWKQEVFASTQSPEEIRLLSLCCGKEDSDFLVYAYAEPALCTRVEYAAHRAFQKLFLTASPWGENGVRFSRTSREDGSSMELYASLSGCESVTAGTDRLEALGRGKDTIHPDFVEKGMPAFKSIPIDPCICLCGRLHLRANEKAEVVFSLMAETEQGRARDPSEAYSPKDARQAEQASRQYALSRLGYLNVDGGTYERLRRELTQLFAPGVPQGTRLEALRRNKSGKEALWRFSISGDRPVALISVHTAHGVALARELALLLRFGALCNLTFDAVALCSEPAGYTTEVYDAVSAALNGLSDVKVLRAQDLSDEEKQMLRAFCTLQLHERGDMET